MLVAFTKYENFLVKLRPSTVLFTLHRLNCALKMVNVTNIILHLPCVFSKYFRPCFNIIVLICIKDKMGLVARKPVFGVSDKASLKQVSSATEISLKIEISPVASLHIILSKTRTTKALIRLRGCAGWSAPVLFANPRRQVFSRRGPNKVCFSIFNILS